MKTLNIFLLFASILCTASCVFEEQSSNLQEAVVTVSQKGISPDIVDLSAEDARTVASIFTEEYGTKAGAAKAVGDVIEIKNADGQVTMYVVNFTNDNGYIVVSATKKFYPVLVEVEKGCFDKNVYKTGAEVLLEEYKADIAYFKALPEDSTVRFRQMWRQYEKQQANNIYSCMTKSGNDDLMNLVPGSVAQLLLSKK